MFPASADFNGNKNRKLPVNAKPEERMVRAVNEFNITSAAEREKRERKKKNTKKTTVQRVMIDSRD